MIWGTQMDKIHAQKMKRMTPYLVFFVALFYGLGFVLPFEVTPALLLVFYPLCLIGAGVFYAIKHGFKWYFLVTIPYRVHFFGVEVAHQIK